MLLIVAVVTWLGLAAWLEPGGAQAASIHSGRISAGQPIPSKYEWWFTNWDIQQKVWPLTEGGGVTVAVIDSGIQASISDLRGAVLPGGDTTGAGSNGETDFDVVDGGHGTAMAVLIAGQGYGGGIVGIAPQAKLLPVNAVLEDNTPPSDLAAG
ncbi:MAG TPA: S8 family serine peptidase, partial [Streptosporangiaceae bacterium]